MATSLCFQEGQSADAPSLGLNTASISKRLQVDRLGCFPTEAPKRGPYVALNGSLKNQKQGDKLLSTQAAERRHAQRPAKPGRSLPGGLKQDAGDPGQRRPGGFPPPLRSPSGC